MITISTVDLGILLSVTSVLSYLLALFSKWIFKKGMTQFIREEINWFDLQVASTKAQVESELQHLVEEAEMKIESAREVEEAILRSKNVDHSTLH